MHATRASRAIPALLRYRYADIAKYPDCSFNHTPANDCGTYCQNDGGTLNGLIHAQNLLRIAQ
tara:strand:+ start:422 stop:610 length:189 start_codon:yes stop_codon:yes gene_type:complete